MKATPKTTKPSRAARRAKARDKSARPHLGMGLTAWAFLAVATALGLAAVRGQHALLYMLSGAMLGMVVFSAFMARAMMSGISLSRDLPTRVWQNQTVHLGYFLRNDRRGACLALRVEEVAPEGISSARGFCVHLPGHGSFRAGARFVATRRGRVRVFGVRLSTAFPFGILTAGRTVRSPREMIVWPARGRLRKQLLLRGAAERSSSPPSPRTGGQDEFFGLRDYREGDNPRWIHWRKSALRPMPLVREMSRPLPEELYVALDTRCDGSQQSRRTLEKMLRLAATLVDHAFARGYRVGLIHPCPHGAAVLDAGGGNNRRAELLDALSDVEAAPSLPLSDAVSRVRRNLLRQAQVIAVTPDASACAGALSALRAGCRSLRVISASDMDAMFEDLLAEGA
jgi:uncharacterized protein (DUF58 family)